MPPRRSRRLALAIPVITLILAFTAIPAELRPPQPLSGLVNLTPQPYDLVANVIGYVPLGVVLASNGWPVVAAIAAATSAVAEATQLFTRGREASLIDLATNVAGAMVGWAIARRWRVLSPSLQLTRLAATMAAALAVACFFVVARVTPREFEDVVTTASKTLALLTLSANDRGAGSADGRLEARWTFDPSGDSTPQVATAAGIVHDASDNGVDGVLRNGPALVPGIVGQGLQLDGTSQHVTFETHVALRLKGSMTITAWINSSRFPESDAAIVSSYGGFGYQLDTTVDQGPRTIGFRVTNAWGQLTSRYGATPLETDTWYHVAGVFDARSRTLDVFLDGELDNGCLAGTVTGSQTISPDPVFIGRPPRDEEFAFAGIVDDVRIYSLAPSQNEIQKEMREASRPPAAPRSRPAKRGSELACPQTGETDARTNGLIVAMGVFAAIAAAALWPSTSYRWGAIALSLLAGFVMTPAVVGKVPGYRWWLAPLLALAGGIVVALCTGPADRD